MVGKSSRISAAHWDGYSQLLHHPNPQEDIQFTDCKPQLDQKLFYSFTVGRIGWLDHLGDASLLENAAGTNMEVSHIMNNQI